MTQLGGRDLAALGRAVRELREERGLSVRELADAIPRVSRRRLEAIEAGRIDPRYDVLLALADGLGVRVSVLVRRAVGELDEATAPDA